MYDALLRAIELSPLGDMARGGVWLYPIANTLHVLGAALLVGAILVFDVRVLRGHGASGTALIIAAIGLAVLAVTGPVMFSAEAGAIGHNPAFQIKMLLLAIGLINIAIFWLGSRFSLRRENPLARLHAVVSALVWPSVLVFGRLIAYL